MVVALLLLRLAGAGIFSPSKKENRWLIKKTYDNVGKCRIYSLGPEPSTLGNASRACSSRGLPWKQWFFKIRNHLNLSNSECFPPCGVVVEGLPAAEAAGVRAVLDVHHVSETIFFLQSYANFR